MRTALILLLLCLPFSDSDGDGLTDQLEADLLSRFQPHFFLSQGECDAKPARFAADAVSGSAPKVLARDGTIYGRVSALPSLAGVSLQLQYFHLWGKDCGQAGHDLDAEHVSAMIHADSLDAPLQEWTAVYWYGAAHEDTVCDASHGARAVTLGAEAGGPNVYISAGKHASFLTLARCRQGCGGDKCRNPVPMQIAAIENLGEPRQLSQGVAWVNSPQWNLAGKLDSDFPSVAIGQMSRAKGTVAINDSLVPLKALFLGGDSALDAVSLAETHTDSALATTKKKTSNSLRKAVDATGAFLGLRRK